MRPARPRSRTPRALPVAAALVAVLFSSCVSGESPAASKTVAYIPNHGGGAAAPVIYGYEDPSKTGSVVPVDLGQTSPTQMFIELSQPFAPAGTVSFLVTNTDTVTHEFVVLSTDQPADSFPLTTFEGEPDRIDEDAPGLTNVGETGDMKAGTQMMLTLDLPEGHYAVVCNLKGHYAAGMHQDFWVTQLA